MTAATLTLTDFLLARIAEDEAVAMNASHHRHLVHDYERDNYGFLWVKTTRVLAECEAKRRIVEMASDAERRMMDGPDFHSDGTFHTVSAWMGTVLRALALPYADHPEFREEWRP